MNQVIEREADKPLSATLEDAARALPSDAEQSASGAGEVLDMFPGQQQALQLLVSSLHVMGAEDTAIELLAWMVREHPNLASIQFEYGLLLGKAGKPKDAAQYLRRAVELEPNHPSAWRALGDQLAIAGEKDMARRAHKQHVRLSLRELKLMEDAAAGNPDELFRAEQMLRQALDINPTDVIATHLLGLIFLQLGRLREAESMFERALALAPDCMESRTYYFLTLSQLMDWKRANVQIRTLLESDPDNANLIAQLAGNLIMLGERDEALRLFEKARTIASDNKEFWLNYGHAARSVGQDNDTIVQAYRKAIELDPGFGAAWWALADLKTYRFSKDDIAAMRGQLAREDLRDSQRCHLAFALGKALEDEAAYEESFRNYDRANALRRPYAPYNADAMHADTLRAKSFFTREFIDARQGMGCPDPDPIFIVGMPRAGSTLVEQILASHSSVEGTMELFDLGDIVVELMRQHPEMGYPTLLQALDGPSFRKLGQDYLERTRYQRKLGRPFFTDKAGNNFVNVGLIQLILPNAKIIDARRHPLACGFSCFKQAFAPGALHLSYDQTDIGRYYRDYVELMAHYDDVLPGRVHRVFYEELVRDPEGQIRNLLEYCELPFEEQCLRFHETDRSVRTSSSQQVRQPIQKRATEAWQHYDTWLQPMKDALGEVLTLYPRVPRFN